MGRMVESMALQQGHTIAIILKSNDNLTLQQRVALLSQAEVAIDFSINAAVRQNVDACLEAGVPLVEGVTGWPEQLTDVRQTVQINRGAMVFGANFSIGVNLFYRFIEHSSKLLAAVGGYEPFIEESHHSRKKDSPSGTALKINDIVAKFFPQDISIAATRAGHIPGAHRVGFDSLADTITLTHTARSREGFVAGALLAASWIIGRKGFYEFSEALDEILTPKQD